MGEMRPKHLLPEVLVRGYEDSVFFECLRKDLVITYTARFVEDGDDIEILLTQPPCQSGACALVYQKTHLGGLRHQGHERGSLQSPRCEKKAGLNIFFLQSLVFIQDFRYGCALSQKAQDMFHGQASPLNDRLSDHDLGIQGNTFK